MASLPNGHGPLGSGSDKPDRMVKVTYSDGDGLHKSKLMPAEFVDEYKRRPEMQEKFMEFVKDLLSTGYLADVTFVLKGQGEGEEDSPTVPVRLKAHKSLLRSKSEFFSVLCSKRWEQSEIDLTSSLITQQDFKVFLEFLYLDRIVITSDNAMPLYHLSDMYQVVELKLKCEEFFEENIDDDNVFELFHTVYTFNPSNPSKGCAVMRALISFICKRGERMLDKREFKELDSEKLSLIFSWGNFECKPIKLLRFCIRKTYFFGRAFGYICNLLQDRKTELWIKIREGRKILFNFDMLSGLIKTRLGISYSNYKIPDLEDYKYDKRTVGVDTEFAVERLPSLAKNKGWTNRPNRWDRISFRVSESITLTGIGIFGCKPLSDRDRPYRKRLRTPTDEDYIADIKVYIHGQQHRELCYEIHNVKSNVEASVSKILKVSFHTPIEISPDQLYTVAVQLAGPPSYQGEKGKSETLAIYGEIPLIFEFEEANPLDRDGELASPTGIPIGQIPVIYFKVPQEESDDSIQIL